MIFPCNLAGDEVTNLTFLSTKKKIRDSLPLLQSDSMVEKAVKNRDDVTLS
jgi:hypothetical protein